MSIWIIVIMMVFLVGSFLATRITIGGIPALFMKTIASFGFVFAGVLAMIYVDFQKYYAFILVGLMLGMIGDMLLDLKVIYKQDSGTYLNYGMLAFGLGHLMYFMALGNYYGFSSTFVGKTFIALAIGLGVGLAVVFAGEKLLKLNFGEFFWQSFLYCALLVAVMVLSLLTGFKDSTMVTMNIGLVLFFASDLVLSMQYFGGKQNSKTLTIINHILYYTAQVLIVAVMY